MQRRRFLGRLALLASAAVSGRLSAACTPAPVPTAEPATLAPIPPPTATQVPVRPSPTPMHTPTSAAAAAVPTATPQPLVALPVAVQPKEPNMSTVTLIKTTDRATGVQRAIELLGINSIQGKQVLLKPNFNSADACPGSTHNDTLRAMIEALQMLGAREIALGDRAGMGDTRQVMISKGVYDLLAEYGISPVAFEALPEEAWELFEAEGLHWRQGFPVPHMLLEAEAVVQTCNLKTHRYGGHFTLSLKNSVGLAGKRWRGHDYMSELHGSPDQRRMIAEINLAYRPALIVMDGVEAFTHGGPATGTKVAAEVVLASTDRVAIDAVGVAILRLFGTTDEVSRGRVFEQEQLARAVELGLGVSGPEHIKLVTDDAASAAYADEIKAVLLA